MKVLDRFFDTYQKRVFAVYAVIVLLLLYFQYQNASLSYALFQIEDVNGLYGLLNYTCVYETLVGRAILGFLNYANTAGGMVSVLFYMLDMKHIILFVLVFLFWFHGIEANLWQRAKWHVLFSIVLQWLAIAIVFVGAMIAMGSGTALMAIEVIHKLAIFYGIVQIVLVIVHVRKGDLPFFIFYSVCV